MRELAIEAEALWKRFGDVEALRGVDLHAPIGSVLGLLGPNGAGKTTAVRILTTLLKPDAGHARVAGRDVVREPARVREQIGLAGQYAAVDGNLSGAENLEMVGRLYHLGRRASRRRAADLLETFGLVDDGKRLVRTYSGGMRRRLDLAAALVARPPMAAEHDAPTQPRPLRVLRRDSVRRSGEALPRSLHCRHPKASSNPSRPGEPVRPDVRLV